MKIKLISEDFGKYNGTIFEDVVLDNEGDWPLPENITEASPYLRSYAFSDEFVVIPEEGKQEVREMVDGDQTKYVVSFSQEVVGALALSNFLAMLPTESLEKVTVTTK